MIVILMSEVFLRLQISISKGTWTFLHKAAYSGGLDFKHSWKVQKYYTEGSIGADHVTGSAKVIEFTQQTLMHLSDKIDVSHVKVDPNRTSLTETGGRIEAGDGNWRYNDEFTNYSFFGTDSWKKLSFRGGIVYSEG